jgi:hypothetical protein
MPLEDFREILKPYLANANLLLPTASEAQAITGEADENRAAKKMAQKPGAITLLSAVRQGVPLTNTVKTLMFLALPPLKLIQRGQVIASQLHIFVRWLLQNPSRCMEN